MNAKKLALKGFTLLTLLLSLIFFSKDSTKALLVSAQTEQERTSPEIIISSQDDAPLRIISTSVVSAESAHFKLQVMIQNQGPKAIRAYALTSKAASEKGQNGYTDFQNLTRQSSIWQPSAIKVDEVSDMRNEPIVSVRLTIDFVEFTNGSTWGPDIHHSSDLLTGQREGARIERERIRQLLKSKGPKALGDEIQDADFSRSEALAGENHSERWLEGFHSGVSSIRRRLKGLSSISDVKQVETELSKPFDTSEERQR